jgi:IS30 family transposase
MTNDQKILIDKLRLQGCSYMKISKEIGVSENTVKFYCRRSATTSVAKETIAACEYCGKPIDKSKRSAMRFCSDACRNKWWNEHPKREMLYVSICACCGIDGFTRARS